MKLSNKAKIFKALSNEQRLKIFMMIYERCGKGSDKKTVLSGTEASCCAMERAFTKVCERINLSQSTVSHHFKVLQDAGLIATVREGQKYVCSINEEAVQSVRNFLD